MSAPAESSLVLVGWDFRRTPVAIREQLAFSPERTREALAQLRGDGLLAEGVIVSTCNRSEIYGVAPAGRPESALTDFVARFHRLPASEIDHSAYRMSGPGAARHLLRVAAGLESLALGEDQILGQVREAFRLAAGAGAARSVLHRLFQKAFETGKRVRTETRLGTRATSIPGVAFELAQKIYEDLGRKSFLLIGAGEIASIFHDLLLARGVSHIDILNRTPERAERLALHGGTARRLEEMASRLPLADIVVCATSSPVPLLTAAGVRQAIAARRGLPMLILDLGIPRNADPEIGKIENVFLYGVDDLQFIAERNRKERAAVIPEAERIVEEELADFLSWFGALAVVPTLTDLREYFERIHDEEFDRRVAAMANVPDSERKKIQQLSRSMLQTLLRGPTAALKDEPDAARRLDRAEAIRHVFGLSHRPKK